MNNLLTIRGCCCWALLCCYAQEPKTLTHYTLACIREWSAPLLHVSSEGASGEAHPAAAAAAADRFRRSKQHDIRWKLHLILHSYNLWFSVVEMSHPKCLLLYGTDGFVALITAWDGCFVVFMLLIVLQDICLFCWGLMCSPILVLFWQHIKSRLWFPWIIVFCCLIYDKIR